MRFTTGPLTFALAKYSRAVDVTQDATHFTWNHAMQDLVVVFDTFRGAGDRPSSASPPSQLLKVVQGTQVLENIPVEDLVAESKHIITSMQDLRVEIKNEQLPITALVRSPLLAIRYNLSNGKIRRIQLKFTSGSDFDKACNHLRNLGLRMTASEAKRSSTTHTQSNIQVPASSGPSPPPLGLGEYPNRPLTAATALRSYVNFGSAPKRSSPLAQNSFSISSDIQETAATPIRPISAYSSLANKNSSQHTSGAFTFDPLVPPEYFPRPDSSSSILDRPNSGMAAERRHVYDLPTLEGDAAGSYSRPGSSSTSTTQRISESLLPPRRELPFARSTPPKSSGSDSIRPTSRPSSSAMAPPPRPVSSRINDSSSSLGQFSINEPNVPTMLEPVPAKETGKQKRPTPSLTKQYSSKVNAPQATIIGEVGRQTRPGSSSSRPSSRRADIAPSTAMEGIEQPIQQASSPSRPPSRMTDLPPLPKPTFVSDIEQSATNYSSSPSHHIPIPSSEDPLPLRSLSDAEQNALPASPSLAIPTPAHSEASYHDRIITELSNDTRGNSDNHLQLFASQSDEDRMMILNDFMMQHINDDTFIKLVEDVEACWVRVGLGLD